MFVSDQQPVVHGLDQAAVSLLTLPQRRRLLVCEDLFFQFLDSFLQFFIRRFVSHVELPLVDKDLSLSDKTEQEW
jgi:hypothetical protein